MLNSQTLWSRGLRFWNATAGSMPAFHRHTERAREGEKKRKETGEEEKEIRDSFVMGDMRMPEKRDIIVEEWLDRER